MWRINCLIFQNIRSEKCPQLFELLTAWYSNVLIELLQARISLPHQSNQRVDNFLCSVQFTLKYLALASCSSSKLCL